MSPLIPVFHHQGDVIEARLTIVFTALIVARHLQDVTWLNILRIVQTLRPLQITVRIAGDELTADEQPTPSAQAILNGRSIASALPLGK